MSVIALLLLAAQATPAPTTPPPAPPKVDCSDADHTALDFWIGDWDVFPAGAATPIARNRIEKIVGCAISETYDQFVGPRGRPLEYHGRAIGTYKPADKSWQQNFVDSAGTVVNFKGGLEGNAMVFVAKAGATTIRMTLSPNADGTVRQHGELSDDDGKTWRPNYDLTYKKRTAATGG